MVLSAFVSGAALPVRTPRRASQSRVKMSSAEDVVNKYYPLRVRHRAPTITFDGVVGIRLSMKPIAAFVEVDKDTPSLFDYSDPNEFVPNKPVPPSAISWPSGDGRGVAMKGYKGFFVQPNLKEYGPFPDFYKVRLFLFSCCLLCVAHISDFVFMFASECRGHAMVKKEQ